jgi:hypothetical protein
MRIRGISQEKDGPNLILPTQLLLVPWLSIRDLDSQNLVLRAEEEEEEEEGKRERESNNSIARMDIHRYTCTSL